MMDIPKTLPSLEKLILQSLSQRLPNTVSGVRPEAAVLVPILAQENGDSTILLTKRSQSLNSHAGEVAFPGGKADAEDNGLVNTALRETHEEVGIHADQIRVLGELDQVTSKAGIRVSSFVGLIKQPVHLKLNNDELDQAFEVPLSFFLKNDPEIRLWENAGKCWQVPFYHFQNFQIWGLTAMIIINLLNVVFNRKIPYQAPVR